MPSGPPRRSPDGDDVARKGHPRRYEGALAEEYAVPEPGAGHEDRRVPDLAEVAHGCPNHEAAMAEHGAAPDRRRNPGSTDDHRVLEHRRSGADLDRCIVGADDGALGE